MKIAIFQKGINSRDELWTKNSSHCVNIVL